MLQNIIQIFKMDLAITPNKITNEKKISKSFFQETAMSVCYGTSAACLECCYQVFHKLAVAGN